MFNLKKNSFLEEKCNPYVLENISGHWFFRLVGSSVSVGIGAV